MLCKTHFRPGNSTCLTPAWILLHLNICYVWPRTLRSSARLSFYISASFHRVNSYLIAWSIIIMSFLIVCVVSDTLYIQPDDLSSPISHKSLSVCAACREIVSHVAKINRSLWVSVSCGGNLRAPRLTPRSVTCFSVWIVGCKTVSQRYKTRDQHLWNDCWLLSEFC